MPVIPQEVSDSELNPEVDNDLGLVEFVLSDDTRTTVVGDVYGLDFVVRGSSFTAQTFFDHFNRRLKVSSYCATDIGPLASHLFRIADANRYDKIIVKARSDDRAEFEALGYETEARLGDSWLISAFRSTARRLSRRIDDEEVLVQAIRSHPILERPLALRLETESATRAQVGELATLYGATYRSYPTPVSSPAFLRRSIEGGNIYRFVRKAGQIVSAAAVEIDVRASAAEMTDCVTLPPARNLGLMSGLLENLEADLRARGIRTAFSLARAMSVGMNTVLHDLGYEFSGRMINNCQIDGSFEDMNLWTKTLAR